MAGLATFATLAKLALYVMQALGWANNLAERRAGAAERTANEGAVIAAREKDGAQISDQVSALPDKALDDQLKGN